MTPLGSDKEKEDQLQKMELCSIWLIKHLCIDTEAKTATLEQDITHFGKTIGRYKLTISKLS